MFNEHLLNTLKLLIRKFVIYVVFYQSLSKKLLFKYTIGKSCVWKTANYADSYWFQLDSKTSNLNYLTLLNVK